MTKDDLPAHRDKHFDTTYDNKEEKQNKSKAANSVGNKAQPEHSTKASSSDEVLFYHDTYPNDPANRSLKNSNKIKNEKGSEDSKKFVVAYKYSAKGMSSLYEAIILQGQPCFVTWSQYHDSKKIKEYVEEATRIIRPPTAEEYPYTPYEFADEQELNDYFHRANMSTWMNPIK